MCASIHFFPEEIFPLGQIPRHASQRMQSAAFLPSPSEISTGQFFVQALHPLPHRLRSRRRIAQGKMGSSRNTAPMGHKNRQKNLGSQAMPTRMSTSSTQSAWKQCGARHARLNRVKRTVARRFAQSTSEWPKTLPRGFKGPQPLGTPFSPIFRRATKDGVPEGRWYSKEAGKNVPP